MPGPLKLVVYGLILTGVLCLAIGVAPLTRGPGCEEAAAGVITKAAGVLGKPRAMLAAAELQQLQQERLLATRRVSVPAQWSPPRVGELLGAVSRHLPGAVGQKLFSGGSEGDAESGSYASVTPNQLGTIGASGRMDGSLRVYLRGDGFSRAEQEAQDIALLAASPESEGPPRAGYFWIRFFSPGWYLIAWHLTNPNTWSADVHNTVRATKLGAGTTETLIDDTQTAPPGGEFTVPALKQITEPGLYLFYWHVSSTSNEGSGLVVFRSLTVDKL